MKDPLLSPSRRTLNNYDIFYAKPSRKTLNKFGKPSTTLIIRNSEPTKSFSYTYLLRVLPQISFSSQAKGFAKNEDKSFALGIVALIQTLGRRDLSGCFLVHICAFYSSYSSYFVFLCAPSKIFRAKMEPIIQSSFPH